MRMSGWSSDVCSSDLRAWQCAAEYQRARQFLELPVTVQDRQGRRDARAFCRQHDLRRWRTGRCREDEAFQPAVPAQRICQHIVLLRRGARRSEEHTSELQSFMRISYDVFCFKKKKSHTKTNNKHTTTHYKSH